MPNLNKKISKGTEETERTLNEDSPFNGSPKEIPERTTVSDDLQNSLDFDMEVISPNQVPPEKPDEPEIKRPSFMVYDDYFVLAGSLKPPGLYWHGFTGGKEPKPIDIWICCRSNYCE